MKTTHQRLKAERKEYKIRVKTYCNLNFVKQREIAAQVGITEQELYNMLNGFQCTIGNMDFSEMWGKIKQYCGKNL